MGIRHYSQNWDGFVYGRSFRFCNGNKRLCLRSQEIFRYWKLFENLKIKAIVSEFILSVSKNDGHLLRKAILCFKNTTFLWSLWIYLIFSVSCTFLWILHISLNLAYFSLNSAHFSEFWTFLWILHIPHNFEQFSEFCTFYWISQTFALYNQNCTHFQVLYKYFQTLFIFQCMYQLAVHFSKWFHNSYFCFVFTIKETIPFSSLYIVYCI